MRKKLWNNTDINLDLELNFVEFKPKIKWNKIVEAFDTIFVYDEYITNKRKKLIMETE